MTKHLFETLLHVVELNKHHQDPFLQAKLSELEELLRNLIAYMWQLPEH